MYYLLVISGVSRFSKGKGQVGFLHENKLKIIWHELLNVFNQLVHTVREVNRRVLLAHLICEITSNFLSCISC